MSKWIWKLADNGWADWICPECGWRYNDDIHVTLDYKYCPMCGECMCKEDKGGTDSMEKVYIVSYYNKPTDKEPIITAWKKESSAQCHMRSLINIGKEPWMDKAPLYNEFIVD